MDIVGLVLGVFATIALLASAAAIAWKRHIITRWKAVDAMIIGEETAREARLTQDTGRGGLVDDILQSPLGRRGGRDDGVVDAGLMARDVRRIEYQYAYEGRWYTSTSLGLGNTRDRAEHLEQFPVGRRVIARINPANPSNSILLWRPAFRSYAGVLFAAWLLTVIFSVDFHETPEPGWFTLPESWTAQIVAWWLLGIAALVHFSRLGGQLGRGAVVVVAVYFAFASSPYLLPWATENLWPPIAQWLQPFLPEGGVETLVLYSLGGLLAVGGIVLVLVIVHGIVMALVGAHRFHRSFVPVSATITLSEIRKEYRSSAGGKTPGYWWYWPEIRFDYRVDNQQFDTGVYAPSTAYGGARGDTTTAMQAIVDAHPVGSIHEARYDPKQPHSAWLVSDTLGQHLKGALKIAAWLVVLPLALLTLVAVFAS